MCWRCLAQSALDLPEYQRKQIVVVLMVSLLTELSACDAISASAELVTHPHSQPPDDETCH